MLLGATWSDVFCLPSVGVDVRPSPGLRFEGRSSEHPCRDSCALRTLRVIPINEVIPRRTFGSTALHKVHVQVWEERRRNHL